ncbi:MAG: hypothetical protein ACK4VI_05215 [Alphaproteobacteria bacterium]
MTVIPFRAKTSGIEAAPIAESFHGASKPKPNFEDPHSRDFPDEPKYDKRLCGFLTWDEEAKLIRLATSHHLKVNVHENSIYLSRRYDPKDHETADSIHILRPTRMPYISVAEIQVEPTKAGFKKSQYKMADEEQIITSASFTSLMSRLARHLQTGSPDLPELDFWR